jgi:daunorubicin resistance ABC transporter ATP-binding subunit
MTSAIEAEGLVKRFKGGVVALDGVSFAVEQGSVFGLLGPNGAGKTTVVRILTTVLAADGGRARVLGYDVARQPEMVRGLFGLAGQNAAVDENLTGRENLQMIGRLSHLSRAAARARAAELLEEFGLLDAAERSLKTYSGGMRRRLDVAAALVARASVLFLDEPTTGLDPQSRAELWSVIERLVEGGTTVLLTTQYLEEADRLASRLAVVDRGRVISQGTPAELKAALGRTVLEIELPDSAAAELAARAVAPLSAGAPGVYGSSVELPAEGGPRTAMEALRVLDREGIEPVRLSLREPSLDDVFLALTGHRAEQGATSTGEGARGRGPSVPDAAAGAGAARWASPS